MCKFKVGDKVVVFNSSGNPDVIKKGLTGVVLDNSSFPFVQFDIEENEMLHNANGLGESGKCFTMTEREIKLLNNYKQSNRYKLQQAIKATGFHAEKLSLATGFKKGYFSDYTSESRFNSRGDITEDRLNSLLTTLAFAERELLGVGAKTVGGDETHKPSQVKLTIDDIEIRGAVVESCELSFEDYPHYDATVDYHAEAKVNHNGEIKFAVSIKGEEIKKAISEKVGEVKKDLDKYIDDHNQPKLSNFTKVGIIAIVILLLILWLATR